MRWIGQASIPLATPYDAITFFTLCITIVYAYLELRVGLQTTGLFILGISAFFQIFVSFRYSPFGSLPAELARKWFAVHAGTSLLSFSSFAVAAVLAGLYLLLYRELHTGRPGYVFQRIPPLETLDYMSSRAVTLGFILLTIGIGTGMLWANDVWKKPWSWDPKQCLSLTTWLAYAAYVGLRLRTGFVGKRVAVFAIVGFILSLFTFVLVDVLFHTEHSFGNPEIEQSINNTE
jgi:cytochrome c-type biogenesis protein CcsB